MEENVKKLEELKEELKCRERALQMAYMSDQYDSSLISKITNEIEEIKEQIEELEEDE